MAAPVLLVADDLATIAAVRRLVGKEGYELILATSAADALIAFGHHLPGVVLLDPKVESERGGVVLEELQSHPDAGLAKVLLLGESVPGFAWPVVPLPPEAATFVPMLEDAMRGGPQAEGWTVPGAPALSADAQPAAATKVTEPDAWRATAPKPPGLSPIAALDPSFRAVVDDSPQPDAHPPPHEEQGGPPLERAIALAAAARLHARESALAREAAQVELAQTAQRLQEEKDLERAENQKTLQLVERLRGDLADEKGRVGEARIAAEREHYQGLLAEKDAAIEQAEKELEALRDEAMQSGKSAERRAEELSKMARAMEAELERVKKERDAARSDVARAGEIAARLSAAEETIQKLQETLRSERERAQAAVGRSSDENSGLQRLVAQLEDALEAQKRLHEDEVARRSELESTLASTLKHAEEQETRAHELEMRWKEASAETGRTGEGLHRATEENARLHELSVSLRKEREVALGEKDRLSAELSKVTAERDHLTASVAHLSAEKDLLAGQVAQGGEASERLVAERDALTRERDRLLGEKDELTIERDLFAEERGKLTAENARLIAERDDRAAEVERLTELAARAQAEAVRLASEHAALAGQSAALSSENAGLAAELAALKQGRGDAQREVDALRDEVRKLEARAAAAESQAATLEEKLAMPVKVAGRTALMVPRAATVDRERLAELVCQLVLGRNEVKLELGTADGLRSLWLSRGALVAAESSHAGESLIERARKDGLIDARQESELRMLRLASAREVLGVLRSRGFLRQAESAPLVQRYVEQVALDALSEGNVGYRVSEESAGPEVLALEAPRPLLPLLAEALRRGLAPEALLELLGGGEAIPVSRESSLDLRSLGFTEKERRLLGLVDGQATVEELSMVAGVKAEASFRALLVARYLGLVEVRPPSGQGAALDPELDVKRLLAKFEEVQEADYFTILGLGRAAGTDEVQRSFERLSREFDPIRFSGHPDARLQQQAQIVYRHLEEAARALEDDRRRVEYARHLLD